MRRLITLLSAGGNRIVMIRRELPPTEGANWAVLRYRTKHGRILLSASPGPITGCCVLMGLVDASVNVRCRPTGGGRMMKTGKTKPAIFSYKETFFCIAARDRPGRAQRARRIEEPGPVGRCSTQRRSYRKQRHPLLAKGQLYPLRTRAFGLRQSTALGHIRVVRPARGEDWTSRTGFWTLFSAAGSSVPSLSGDPDSR